MKKTVLLSAAIVIASVLTVQAGAYPPPEKSDLTIRELDSKIYDLDRKVIELKFAHVRNIKQVGQGQYTASLGMWYRSGSSSYTTTSKMVHFSGKEAKEFFDDLVEDNDSTHYDDRPRETVYVYIEDNKIWAIGERYKKRGDEYSW